MAITAITNDQPFERGVGVGLTGRAAGADVVGRSTFKAGLGRVGVDDA